MELKNELGEKIQLADNLTLKEMVDLGLIVVLADRNEEAEESWVPSKQDE